jgi:cysteinyl-tRNA synthetase
VQAPYRERFWAALCDDLNAPQALALAWEVARSQELAAADRRDLLLGFDAILGLDLATGVPRCEEFDTDPRIDALLLEREEARKRKDWATADRIRDEFVAEGVEVVDTPEGPRWRRK